MQSTSQFETFRQDFVRYLHNTKQIEEESIDILKNTKIAISGSYLIHNIIKYGNINPLQGFSKYQLSRYVRRLLDCFQSYSIKTVVIFEGIVYNKDVKPNFQEISQKVRSAWEKILEDPSNPEIVPILNEISYHFFTETEIVKILDEYNVEYMHAPYYSVSQMKYFVEYTYCQFACCGLEGIIFNCGHVIVDFDLQNGKFYYIEVKKFQKTLGLDPAKINQFFLVQGYNPNIHTFIPFDYLDYVVGPKKDEEPKTEYCFDSVKAHITSNAAINKILNDDQVNIFHTLRRKLELNLIFNSDCDVDLLTASSHDSLNENFGPYFPSDVYVFFAFNLIERELIDSIANGHFIIRPPLSDSAEYHHHIDNFYKIMLEKITGIFTNRLNTKFKTAGAYSLIRFYFQEKNFTFTPREYKPAKFIIKQSFLDKNEHLGKAHKQAGFCKTLQYFTEFVRETTETKKPTGSVRKESLDFVLSTKLSPLTKANKQNSEESIDSSNRGGESPEISEKSAQSPAELNLDQPQSAQEILHYLYLSFLETYDYVNTHNKNLMVIGAALRKCDENFEESLVMLLELMKPNLCLINGREFSNSRPRKASTEAPFSGSEKREHIDHQFYQINLWTPEVADEQKEEIILISRVFALINTSISASHVDANFADYDYDLCQYLNVLKHLQKMLRFSFEALMLNTYFMHCNSRKDAKIFFSLKKHLPFKNSLSISLGIAIKKLLQTKETIEEFKQKNPQFVNLEYDLKAGYILWENVLFLLKYQESKGEFTVELLELFKKANDLLVNRFKELRLLE